MATQQSSKLDFYTRKPVYLVFLILLFLIKNFIRLYTTIFKFSGKKPDQIKSIAAVWFWPYDFPSASFTRLGKWKGYFEKEGIKFDNFYVGTMAEKVNEYEGNSWTIRYWFYIKILLRRFPQLLALRKYDVVWVDRWFLPYYPSKDAFWERAIKKMVPYFVIDSTDGTDYEGNPNLIMDIFGQADRITVAYEGLYNFYRPIFKEKVFRFNYTVIEDDYKLRTSWEQKDKFVIGWMGSPYNFDYVKDIEKELQKVAAKYPFKFIIICRQDVAIDIPGAEIEYHRYGKNYEELIQSFDIGISPFTVKSFGNTGKIGMKHQEFLLCQIPQVCSPQGISEHAVNNENCLIADEIEEWAPAIIRLMEDEALRKKLAIEGRKMCLEHYTFDGQWPLAKKALSEF